MTDVPCYLLVAYDSGPVPAVCLYNYQGDKHDKKF